MDVNFLFVYGKLREFYADEETFEIESLITLPAKTTGLLYEYDDNAVLVEDTNQYVYGNLVSATDIDVLLRHTDAFMEFDEEDYENSKYVRGIKEVEVEILGEKLKVWCYVFPNTRRHELNQNGKLIESGDWFKYRRSLDHKGRKGI